jgi:chemotaxis-related protein WspB
MLALLFKLGAARYALDLGGLTAILPNSRIRQIPHAPPEVAGEFNWRGRMVPVIDLRRMFFGQDCEGHLTTRLIVFPWRGKTQGYNVALRAEGITDTLQYLKSDIQPPSVSDIERPGLVGMLIAGEQVIRLLDPQTLVWDKFHDVLFCEAAP